MRGQHMRFRFSTELEKFGVPDLSDRSHRTAYPDESFTHWRNRSAMTAPQ